MTRIYQIKSLDSDEHEENIFFNIMLYVRSEFPKCRHLTC